MTNQGDDAGKKPAAQIVRVTDSPLIDGLLDDTFWQSISPIGPLHQVEPVAGGTPSERTDVYLAFDDQNIYVGLRCFDSEPGQIRATQAKRDANLDPDDRVELLFDPFHDRRNAFWFQISPAGSKGDALITRNGVSFNKQWDGLWFGRARLTDEGWQAEISIPVQTLNFDPDGRSWGFNVRRFIRRKNEEVRWASPTPRKGFFEVAQAGTLNGLEGLHKGLGIDLKPFGVLNRSYDDPDDSDPSESNLDLDAGLDLFYSISSRAKLSLSFNTDFAETEVDQRRVNLTRFPLFFPEKRDFFLEDSGVFFFGPSRQRDAIPFFSRRIGLSDGGEVPLQLAAKITGRKGGWSYGVLDVQTDSVSGQGGANPTDDLGSQNLSALRLSRDIYEQSDVGLILTNGDPAGESSASTWGLDLNLRTSKFMGDRNLQFSSYLQGSTTDEPGGDGLAWFASLVYPNDVHEAFVDVLSVGDQFDPALGFVPRQGIRRYRGSYSFRPRLGNAIRQLEFALRPELVTDELGRTESARTLLRLLEVKLESGDEMRFDVISSREVLDEPFEIREGQSIDTGGYTFLRYGFVAESSNKRPLDVRVSTFAGEFYDGDRLDTSLSAAYRPGAWGSFGLEYERSQIKLPSGDFNVHISRTRFDLQFGPRLSWSNFVQWDNQSDSLGLNSRLYWIIHPGNELFFVVDQAWDWDLDRSPNSQDSNVALKIGYTLRF